MDSHLSVIEDAICQRIVAKVSYLDIKRVFGIPAEVDMDDIDNTLLPKGVTYALVAFEGFDKDMESDQREIDGNIWREAQQWFIFLVASTFRSRTEQLRGDSKTKGAYDLIFDVSAALDGFVPIVGMDAISVIRTRLVRKRANSVIYKLDIITAQDRSSDLSICGIN